jgi:hypothetical protein
VADWAHCGRKMVDVRETTKSPVAKEVIDRMTVRNIRVLRGSPDAFYHSKSVAHPVVAAIRIKNY